MAGLIRLNQTESWSAAGWVFDHMLRVVRPHLLVEGSPRILELIAGTEEGSQHISLEELSAEDLDIFRGALESAHVEMKKKGEESFADPAFYPSFMKRFEELLELIRRTP